MRTAICIASGPSLTQADVDYCRGKGTVYAVNDVYKLAPWADYLYACDYDWWATHRPRVHNFEGQKWTINGSAAGDFGLNLIGGNRTKAWCKDPLEIATGGNSGFQTLNLAAHSKPDRIILLGYDMGLAPTGKRHFFGDHPEKLDRRSDYISWIKHFQRAAPLIQCEVINCTRRTALDAFPLAKLEDIL